MIRALILSIFSLSAIAAENKPAAVTFRASEAIETPLSVYAILAGLLLVALAAIYLKYRINTIQQTPKQADEAVQIITKKRLSAKTILFVIREGNQRICFVEHQHGVSILTKTDIYNE